MLKCQNETCLVIFVFKVFKLGDKVLTLLSMENLIVQWGFPLDISPLPTVQNRGIIYSPS